MKRKEDIEHYLQYRTRELTPTDGLLFLGSLLLVAALVREAGHIGRLYHGLSNVITDQEVVLSASLGAGFITLALFVRFWHRRLGS